MNLVYKPQDFEDDIYKYWIERKYFISNPSSNKEPYTIVIPPPNVTGVLHMGHMLNNTIQDVLIRRARMRGFNACWVPGTDHASIATEAKVVRYLRNIHIKKSDLTRDEFLKHAWEWKEKYGGIILKQLEKLGCSCDWSKTRFTMDEGMSDAVISCFIDLYNKGLIYRDIRMVNWDPEGKTALSDEEVIYKESNSKLYFVKYQLCDSNDYIEVATTRPETIMADAALCVNPNDERYKDLIGKYVLVPVINRRIKIIADEYVDKDFGTGVLKITPAHDKNDYAISLNHDLEIIDILDEAGRLTDSCHIPEYVGLDRFEVRKLFTQLLNDKGLLAKVETYKNQIGTSERTGAVIETRLTLQWWVNMKLFIERNPQVLNAVMNDEIKFYPKNLKNVYKYWIENIKDWCISRQLWWGQRIPAWYDAQGNYVVAKTLQDAIVEFESKGIEVASYEIKQDEDVLDTWFSSWLWPISVFDGIKNKTNASIKYYYPTKDLVTAPEIMFFWVARMIMAGYEWMGEKPFDTVYFTGIVRDKQRRKMSKSLGNSPDPLELISNYGADGVRMGMLLCSPAGNDILFDESQVEQGRNFANKIWNAFRLISSWEVVVDTDVDQQICKANELSAYWIEERLNDTLKHTEVLYNEYKLNEVLMDIYKLVWDDFCSWYLEMIKPEYGKPINQSVYVKTIELFENLLKILHPFMPFITEKIWQLLKNDSTIDGICVAEYPVEKSVLHVPFGTSRSLISKLREFRNSNGISPKEKFTVYINSLSEERYSKFEYVIKKLAQVNEIKYTNPNIWSPEWPRITVGTDEISIDFKIHIDIDVEKEKINKEISHLESFLSSIEMKLANEKFIQNAKPELIEKERKKKSDTILKIDLLKKSLEAII